VADGLPVQTGRQQRGAPAVLGAGVEGGDVLAQLLQQQGPLVAVDAEELLVGGHRRRGARAVGEHRALEALRGLFDADGDAELLQRADADRPERAPPREVQHLVGGQRLGGAAVLVGLPAADRRRQHLNRSHPPPVAGGELDAPGPALVDADRRVAVDEQRAEERHHQLHAASAIPRRLDGRGEGVLVGAQAAAAVVAGAAVDLQRDAGRPGQQPHDGGGDPLLGREDVGVADGLAVADEVDRADAEALHQPVRGAEHRRVRERVRRDERLAAPAQVALAGRDLDGRVE
jgi:hypothetical protein